MARLKVYFVHLRRPESKSKNPDEKRDDPFYEEGSFGCTKCHSRNLLHPRHAHELEGARLAFVQGGKLGSRLVYLTPPVTVHKWKDNCEARWTPAEMPFKYPEAPILVWNDGQTDFPLVEQFARKGGGRTIEARFCSKVRSLARPLDVRLANHVVDVYERKRAKTPPSAIAAKYDEALPWRPPVPDRKRKTSYRFLISQRKAEIEGLGDPSEAKEAEAKKKSLCGASSQSNSACGGRANASRKVGKKVGYSCGS